MRIDHLDIENFKGFESLEMDLHPHFTLFAGENGSGKTSVLDALAVALGIWHTKIPQPGWRNILEEEVRVEPIRYGDGRVSFEPVLPTRITATGAINGSKAITWTRQIRRDGNRTSNVEAKEAIEVIGRWVNAAESGKIALPVLAYYGAGRAWLPTNKKPAHRLKSKKPRRFDAYENCLDTRIDLHGLNYWFLVETAAMAGQGERPGFLVVKQAMLGMIPGAENVRFDPGLQEIVLSIKGREQPFYNLSAGQMTMAALAADIAIKAVTLNAHIFEPGQAGERDPIEVLRQTPGVVLIDELDVHLHPKWQRDVAGDLKRTFPSIQFVCTSHSAQVIGELPAEEVILLGNGKAEVPGEAFGMDSNWILKVLMGADSQNLETTEKIEKGISAAQEGRLEEAEELLASLPGGRPSAAAQRLRSTIEMVRLLRR